MYTHALAFGKVYHRKGALNSNEEMVTLCCWKSLGTLMCPGILNVAVIFPRLLGATTAGRCCMEAMAFKVHKKSSAHNFNVRDILFVDLPISALF